MKLLLTSAGITTQEIIKSLDKLLDNKIKKDIKIGFLFTAANGENGNKDWLIENFKQFKEQGYGWIDLVDIELPNWREKLSRVDVVVIGGGNTFYLLDKSRKTGFDKWILENIENKVFVGISAGSIIMTPNIAVASVDNGDENLVKIEDLSGLSVIDFEISPHTPEDVSYKENKKYSEKIKNILIAIDDSSAIEIVDSEITKIGNGIKEYK